MRETRYLVIGYLKMPYYAYSREETFREDTDNIAI